MKTILVPTDFSEFASYASDFAAQLSLRTGAELCFIHVVEIPSSPESEYYLSHQLIQNMMTEAELKLQEISKKYDYLSDVKAFVTTSNALDGIKSGILSMQADLIIMGKHTHVRGLTGFLYENHTEKIIRYASCPVISVSNKVNLEQWQKAIVAIDPEACHDELLINVKELSGLLGINPHFVWIVNDENTHTLENIDQLKDALKSHMQSKEIKFSSFVSDNTCDGILSISEELGADLVVVSTHARRGLSRLIHGSVTEAVVEKSPIPTLVIQLHQNISDTVSV
jgi:nucleotide-binding universal stress UspA family protein